MKVYRHYRPREVWLPLVILSVIGLVGLGGAMWSTVADSDRFPPAPFFLMMVAVAGVNLWLLSACALEVRLDDEGYVEFLGPLRRSRVPVVGIVSIRPSGMSHSTSLFVLKHREGTIRFDPRLDGMHELVAEIKRQNPSVELRGI